MIIHTMTQRSEEWFEVRRGKITGTDFGTMANGKKATIETLCHKKAAEIITGVPESNNYVNDAMLRGIELEAEARAAYELETLSHVTEVGFVEINEYIGCSPDGLVDGIKDGGIEIKCPEPHTHLKYLKSKDPWRQYKWQVQGALWITGFEWWDFVSYCPSFPGSKRLLIHRVLPDESCFEKLDQGAESCIKRIKELVG